MFFSAVAKFPFLSMEFTTLRLNCTAVGLRKRRRLCLLFWVRVKKTNNNNNKNNWTNPEQRINRLQFSLTTGRMMMCALAGTLGRDSHLTFRKEMM